MKKHKKKKMQEVKWHQHQDEKGNIFGASHPAHLEHKREMTQWYHDLTVMAAEYFEQQEQEQI